MKTAFKLLVILNLLTPLMQHSIAQTILPTATISGNTSVCQNTISPLISFTGANGTPPYTFYYTFPQTLGEQSITTSGTNPSATIAASTFSAGAIVYTLVSVTDSKGLSQAQNGSVTVTVIPSSFSTTSVTICPSLLPYTWHGAAYNAPGNYTFDTTNSLGCDSTANLVLATYNTTSTEMTVIDSSQLPYYWHGTAYNASGTYSFDTTSSTGCDSVDNLLLTVRGNRSTATATISGDTTVCNSSSAYLTFTGTGGVLPYTFFYTVNGGMEQSFTSNATASLSVPTQAAGSFVYSLVGITDGYGNFNQQSGSDTVVVRQPAVSTATISVCSSALPYKWNGTVYSQSGTYTFDTTNSLGCDSLATLVFTVLSPPSTTTISVDSSSLPYKWNKKNYSKAGTYTFTTKGSSGCDSIATLKLSVITSLPPADIIYTTPNVFAKGAAITPLAPASNPAGTVSTYNAYSYNADDVAVDGAGNLYTFKVDNDTVNQITPNGSVTTFTQTKFPVTYGINPVMDNQANMYVIDAATNTVKKISLYYNTITVLGQGIVYPYWLTLDGSGNLYVADNNSNSIIKIAPNGTQTNIYTNSYIIRNIAADPSGNVYVGDDSTVFEINSQGVKLKTLTTFKGYLVGPLATDRQGNLYLTEAFGIYKVAAQTGSTISFTSVTLPQHISSSNMGVDYFGNIYIGNIKISGTNTAPATAYSITPVLPTGLVINNTTGIISGTPSAEIPQTAFVTTASNKGGSVNTQMVLTVTNAAGDTISYNTPNVFTQNKVITPLLPVYSPLQPQPHPGFQYVLNSDSTVAYQIITDKTGNLFILQGHAPLARGGALNVEKVGKDGSKMATINLPAGSRPNAIAVDTLENLYVLDGSNYVNKLQPNGNIIKINLTSSPYSNFTSLTMDAAGNVYVGELSIDKTFNNTIFKIAAGDSVAIVFARCPADGLTADTKGFLYATDVYGNLVIKIAPDGSIANTLLRPFGRVGNVITTGADGNIYITDNDYGQIRMISPDFSNDTTAISPPLGWESLDEGIPQNPAGDIYFVNIGSGTDNEIDKIYNTKRFITGFTVVPPLPAGLKIDSTSGTISGTPSVGSATATYNITALRGMGNINLPIAIKVIAVDTLSVTACSSSLPYIWRGSSYSAAGTYNTYVTGASGIDTSATLILKINASPVATIKGSNTDSVCYGAKKSISVTVTGGVKPYQYSLDGVTWQTGSSFTEPTGIYKITVRDANSCTATTGNITIVQPAAKLSIVSTQINSTSVTVTAAGGFGGYTYSLNGGPFQQSNKLTGVAAGSNTVTVMDINGCTVSATISLLTATISSSGNMDSVCFGAKRNILATATGGIKPYQYSLDGISYQTSNTFSVPAGTYTITVKDANNNVCVTGSITIVQPAIILSLSSTSVNVSCKGGNNGSITLNASGGFGNYLYNISKGSYQVSNVFGMLQAGTYNVSVKDANNCTVSSNVTIKQSGNACSSLSASVMSPAIVTDMTGSLKVNVYPNPSTTEFTLQIVNGDDKNNIELRVTDMLGRTLYRTTGSVFDTYRFGGKLVGGMYIAELINGSQIQVIKLVKGN